ncbi:hypothetical protein EES43_24840 [Streptomyces sp. ADI96-02]|nr:hypothetical protein EES43_24840 [Streptomyces sp. ADI96-02]
MTDAPEPSPIRKLPGLESLTWDQAAGRACVWCKRPLTVGALPAGVIQGCDGVHVLDTEVWAGPCCALPETESSL